MDTLKNDGDIIWLNERLLEANEHLIEIESQDYHGASEEKKEIIASEHSMCTASIWVLEEMVESLQTETK